MMTDEEVLELGFKLEAGGLSHSEIDDILEQSGVKGMKWGQRKQNRALNKASRAKDKEERRVKIDKARERFDSGKARRDYLKAKQEFKDKKAEIGSREARKILNKAKQKNMEDYNMAIQHKDGKEVATSIAIGFGALAIASLAKVALDHA